MSKAYIRWLKTYLETGVFPGDFVGEYETIPVTRRIVAGPREGNTVKRWKDNKLMDTLMECLGVTWWNNGGY